MSWWTHVTGIIKASVPARTNTETMYVAQTVLDHLPEITGSEGGVNTHVYLEDGYNVSQNRDEFFNRSNLGKSDGFGDYKSFNTQTKVLITLSGNLRNRMFSETYRETLKFMCRLSKRLVIDDCLIRIGGEDRGCILTNKNNCFGKMYSYDGENWTDYLRWSHVRDEEGYLIGGKPHKFNNN